ncbi:MAG: DUF1571 domain-containing protein, partial [Planctomycetia bacterium]|nr:DUF1571 domain-containing protein [Planctomycetia bacterium]
MPFRLLLIPIAIALCLAAVPLGPPRPPRTVTAGPALTECEKLPTAAQFAGLARTDPLAMLNASMSRYRCEVRGYTCVMHKQERVGGSLGKPEVIDVAFRDDPFAVVMKWKQGAGLANATLYAKGENNGQLLAKSFIGLVTPSDPGGALARRSSRFSITDFGIYRGTLRTYAIWKRAQDNGTLKTEYLGTKPVPELNGRICHWIRRTVDPPEVDNFSLDETEIRSPERYPKDAIGQVTIFVDVETWLHLGSDIRHPDGSLIASYYFRDVVLNPKFDREQFLPGILKK